MFGYRAKYIVKSTYYIVFSTCFFNFFWSDSLSARQGKKIKEIPWIAYGDIRGNLEPCGCDPLTDLGGLKRLATLVRKERAIHSNLILLSLGNIEPADQAESKKDEFSLKTVVELRPSATLYNHIELSRYHPSHKEYYKRQNYVLSNARPGSSLQRPYRDEISVKGTRILGFVSADFSEKNLVPLSQKILNHWKGLKSKSQSLILLFSGTDSDLEKIVDQKIFNSIIRSNAQSFEADFDHKEKQNPGMLVKSLKDQLVLQVPLGGLGVARGGGAERVVAKPVQELLKPQISCSSNNLFKKSDKCSPMIGADRPPQYISWLSRDYVDDPSMSKIFEQIKNYQADQFKVIAEQRKADLPSSPYVGAKACKACHQNEYEIWENSAHAHAHSTLAKKDNHMNAECISCHVVGYKNKGGFANMKYSPHLANVQCENCHGPRKEHIQNPGLKNSHNPVDAKQQCQNCHKGAHSPKFNFEAYWFKIKHGEK